ncbi:MAG: glycosyltransferase family 4 protein [Gemmatimonadetes bacterium]|nr:glycosyltransferase family 4 protein [Gemmatimonadota bacterium]
MSTRRILFYSPFFHTYGGGVRSVLNLLAGLDAGRFTPTLVTQRESQLTDGARAMGVDTVVIPFPEVLAPADGQLLRYPLHKRAEAAMALLGYNRRVEAVARERGAAAFWARDAKGVLLTFAAARRLRAPLVWDVAIEQASRGFMWALHGVALRTAAAVVTQSERQQAEIFGPARARRFGARMVALRPGIAADRIPGEVARRTPPEGELVVLCVGSVSRRKNQRLLVEAAAPLMAQHPGLRVRLAGAEPAQEARYAADLRALIAEAGIADRVELLGFREDVPALMASADLLVLPSNDEGIPHVVREAMHAGLPVIATAVGGVPEIVIDGETGVLVPPRDPDALRAALARAIAEPARMRALADAARVRVRERYSLEAWTRDYNALLDRLVPAR